MKILEQIKKEIKAYKPFEIYFFSGVILLTVFLSFYFNDSKIALVSAICGMSYRFFAGKGKVYCYYIGLIGTLCYCYLAYKNGFFGNLLLYGLYYFPMQIIGIFKWRKNLKEEKNEIVKTKLTKKERILYLSLFGVLTAVAAVTLKLTGGKTPFLDAFTTVFSILGLLLTVKRCIEQWYIWFFVNLISLIMWIFAFFGGANVLATVIMWAIYFILSIYFLAQWQKEVK